MEEILPPDKEFFETLVTGIDNEAGKALLDARRRFSESLLAATDTDRVLRLPEVIHRISAHSTIAPVYHQNGDFQTNLFAYVTDSDRYYPDEITRKSAIKDAVKYMSIWANLIALKELLISYSKSAFREASKLIPPLDPAPLNAFLRTYVRADSVKALEFVEDLGARVQAIREKPNAAHLGNGPEKPPIRVILSEQIIKQKKSLKQPKAVYIAAYRLAFATSSTQGDIAAALTKEFGIPIRQSDVSRMVKRVRVYVSAGNILPEFPKSPVKAKAVDPSQIDIGRRTDSLTPRQRKSRIK
jgi:hypothetical protein